MAKLPLVMVHGMWGTGEVWGPFKEYFQNMGYYDVHTPTLPYHQQGPAHPQLGDSGLTVYRAFLEDYIARFDQKPILIGHSLGGLLVQQLAARDLCRAAILICPAAPYGIWCVRPQMWPVLLRLALQGRFWRKSFRLKPFEANYNLFNGFPKDQQQAMFDTLVPESGRIGGEAAMWFFDRRKASTVDFTQLVCPVLMLVGTEDRIIPKGVCQANARKFRQEDFEIRMIQGAHWPHREPGWEKVANRCHTWIQMRFAETPQSFRVEEKNLEVAQPRLKAV